MTRGIASVCVALLVALLYGCTIVPAEPLRISANLWIGYTPLFYARERGWLKAHNIELIDVVSLYENRQMYAVGNADAFTGTEYEYHTMRAQHSDLVPLILFDRSTGGDVVLANRTLSQLQESNETIDLYLEADSVSRELFEAFARAYHLEDKRLHVVNRDPDSISHLPMHTNPTLIVTYEPYDDTLYRTGYHKISSSADGNLSFIIIDALYSDLENLQKFHREFAALNRLVAKALEVLKNDPKSFYRVVRPYLHGESYYAFRASLRGIAWIYDRRDRPLLEQLRKQRIPTENLMRPQR